LLDLYNKRLSPEKLLKLFSPSTRQTNAVTIERMPPGTMEIKRRAGLGVAFPSIQGYFTVKIDHFIFDICPILKIHLISDFGNIFYGYPA
jgi:hypothetical protein